MDAILLVAAIAEIRRTLVGGLVREVAAAGPSGLWIEVATSRGVEAVLMSAEPAFPRIVRGPRHSSRPRSLPPLAGVARRVLPGTRLAGVVHQGLDRVVRFDFEPALEPADTVAADRGGRIVAELFGSQPNLLVTDAGGVILEAARHTPATAARPQAPGATYASPPPPARPDPRLLGAPDAIAQALEPLRAAGLAPAEALRKGFAGISDLWAREVAARATDDSPLALSTGLIELLRRVEAGPSDPRWLSDASGHPQAVSPLPLVHLPEAHQHPTASLAEALDLVAAHLRSRSDFATRQSSLRRLVQRLAARLQSRRGKLGQEGAEFARADTCQRMGEILVANQRAVPRGAKEVVLPDYGGGPDAAIRIPLDPTLDPRANAERYFQVARRARRGAARVARRLADTERDLASLESLVPRILVADRPEDLDAAQRDLERLSHLFGPRERSALPAPDRAPQTSAPPAGKRPTTPRRKGEGPEPRRFISSEGLPILVGRDNEGNDFLTLHLARSDDLWLHAEGFPGSHVVVRMRDRTGGVPRRTLIEAAQLAAYYSQARSHGKVAVSYTLKKYVRKPRKSPPGLVTLSHEKSIIVKPDKALVARLAKGSEED
jgi:predicted ribosome quality control (RQC) complex YloA/Tae2 family protein